MRIIGLLARKKFSTNVLISLRNPGNSSFVLENICSDRNICSTLMKGVPSESRPGWGTGMVMGHSAAPASFLKPLSSASVSALLASTQVDSVSRKAVSKIRI